MGPVLGRYRLIVEWKEAACSARLHTSLEGRPGGGGGITDLGSTEPKKVDILGIETSTAVSAGIVSSPSPEVCKWSSTSK